MLFNLETDYAIRIMDCLAAQKGIIDAESISAVTGVTQRFALKILRKLVAGGFVVSQKGAKGGYRLAKPAKEISLLDVIEAVNGEITFSRCQTAEGFCSNPNNPCKFKRVFEQTGKMITEQFQNVHFEGKE
ncbi:MAG: Rrf2 family transcriptional regulator [Clostridia bacterium]|nr:Rrf2 family transcriptional regulator [Clostridia bacterium]MBQ7289178.1 Rrf2 family transcriptional regulator [Clostridia bacterium]